MIGAYFANITANFGSKDVILEDEGLYHYKLLVENSPTTRTDDELELEIEWNAVSDSFTLINQ